MNKLLIYEYINKLEKKDIINYCNKKNLNISTYDIETIYSYIKNDYIRFFNNPDDILNEVKSKVSDNTYKIIIELYNKYKKFI